MFRRLLALLGRRMCEDGYLVLEEGPVSHFPRTRITATADGTAAHAATAGLNQRTPASPASFGPSVQHSHSS
jgi:hypothetical protein